MTRTYRGTWRGIEYDAITKYKLRLGRRWIHPYFYGDTAKIKFEFRCKPEEAKSLKKLYFFEEGEGQPSDRVYVKRGQEVRLKISRFDDERIKGTYYLDTQTIGGVGLRFSLPSAGTARAPQLFSADIQHNDKYLLGWIVPVGVFAITALLAIVCAFSARWLPPLRDALMILSGIR